MVTTVVAHSSSSVMSPFIMVMLPAEAEQLRSISAVASFKRIWALARRMRSQKCP
jgi:hypothetical protein